MEVTLGGDRLGSGNKTKLELRNYERSTHDLSQRMVTSIAPGVLVPFLCIPAMRGDHFSIDLEAAGRTIPTEGPLFGSFKMQLDVFQCPIRLYQGILHNNPLAIGLKMNQVKLPMLDIYTKRIGNSSDLSTHHGKFANNSLLKYLGQSGLGHSAVPSETWHRKINAIPALAYYDIFKNYYANKQEEKAYVIGGTKVIDKPAVTFVARDQEYKPNSDVTPVQYPKYLALTIDTSSSAVQWKVFITPAETGYVPYAIDNLIKIHVTYSSPIETGTIERILSIQDAKDEGFVSETHTPLTITLNLKKPSWITSDQSLAIAVEWKDQDEESHTAIKLKPFNLTSIDDMRMNLLSHHTLGEAYVIDGSDNYSGAEDEDLLPYSQIVATKSDDTTLNEDAMNGLVVKTYQSDIFNAWVNTDWITGENGIAEITKIAVDSGSVYIDSINLAEKLYNMLNRVAVSGGTYEDWQDAVYTDAPRRQIESPIYCGGMSNEIVFEEIVQTAPTDGQPLGTLGGRGVMVKRKGGNIDIKVDEASFIIGIVSLTPRIYQTQGNEFYMTEIQTLDDLHKPALDGIGFQDLIGERMAWWDTTILNGSVQTRHKIGKVPAWLEYMTAVDKAYGDMADTGEMGGYMILNRQYEVGDSYTIKDATTYIDPEKYNYAFAYKELTAQNFWIEINSNITARRLMSAKQIPNI